jgi:glycosyltransferase 2 family protein
VRSAGCVVRINRVWRIGHSDPHHHDLKRDTQQALQGTMRYADGGEIPRQLPRSWGRDARSVALGVLLVMALWLTSSRLDTLRQDLAGTSVDLTFVPAMLVLTTVYYVLKALRWHYYLRISGVRVAPGRTTTAYLAGQWFAFTPAGEFTRSLLLQRYGVAYERSVPAVMVQALIDLASLALVATAILPLWPALAPLVLPVTLPVLAALTVLALPATRAWGSTWLDRTPLGRSRRFQTLFHHAGDLLALRPLLVGLAVGVPTVLAGAGVLLIAGAALDVPGWETAPAVLIYSVSQLLGGLSFLPHGIGVTEGSGTALLALLGVPVGQAAAAIILFRLCTLGWGALLGAAALLRLHLDRSGSGTTEVNV